MRVLWRVIVKEFLQLRRDRKMGPLIFIAPAVQILLFGYAATTDVTNVPLVLVDGDRGAESRALVDRFLGSGYFELAGTEESTTAVDPWLVEGRAQVALVVPPGYGREIAGGRSAAVAVIADGTDANSAVLGLSYASRIVAGRSAEILAASARTPAPPVPIELVPRVWYNPGLESRWFYVPAVLAMVLMVMTMILASMGVVREKEIGTMEQLIVTPLRPGTLIAGKLLPFAVIGVVDLLLVTALTVWQFGVPLRGSFGLLVLLTLPFLLTNLGLGLLVSTVVRNQQQAMMTSAFLLMVPMIYLSGLIFPIANMPRAIQYVTYAVPLRYYTTILRGIFLKGSGIGALWPQASILAGFGIATILLASLRFRKRLD